ncbi:hypothetical protein HMPREF0742_02365 [Rothia aeria F0184]|uniref:Uncharacterized protein n=1 Tax=Rothia aeria F0184 TaxID=888019 RepID=U7UXX4_9MICC|nr:hypothetical protein HMPREF0742_02365 [Rothia aeria F0184]
MFLLALRLENIRNTCAISRYMRLILRCASPAVFYNYAAHP